MFLDVVTLGFGSVWDCSVDRDSWSLPLPTSSLSTARSSARVLTVTICIRSAMSAECAGSPFVLDLVVIVGPTDLGGVGHICH